MSIMTDAFADAAELMARVQGVPDHRFAVIEHPIASADNAGLRERAELAAAVFAEVVLIS
ncbi:MAG: hypothetical protein OSA86_03800 [Acidimicrobiales bacterium]|nr:hypothetical protein [Acidimicrobiales bacterium]